MWSGFGALRYRAEGGSGSTATRFSCQTCHSIVYGTAE
jgi:hypothetical protein